MKDCPIHNRPMDHWAILEQNGDKIMIERVCSLCAKRMDIPIDQMIVWSCHRCGKAKEPSERGRWREDQVNKIAFQFCKQCDLEYDLE